MASVSLHKLSGKQRTGAWRAAWLVGMIWLALLTATAPAEPAAYPPGHAQCVILLHGLARSYRSMRPLQEVFEQRGYRVENIDYPSTDHPVEQLAMTAIPPAVTRCQQARSKQIHFVTHSMGGILVRYYLTRQRPAELGRVVMLAPPNGGSEIVDLLHDNTLFELLNGPAGQQLGTRAPHSLPLALPPVDYPTGIIAGTRSALYDRWFAEQIPGPNDGKVSVERTRVAGMSDLLVVPYDHTFIMEQSSVVDQVLRFVQTGRFMH